MAGVKWIKIVTDVFSNRKIKQIEAMPDADSILVIWFKLLCLAGNVNNSGLITITKDIPYTDEMLANEFKRPLNTVRLALQIFEQFGMVEIIDNIYLVSNWEKYQSVESLDKIREQTRRRVAKHREKQKQLIGSNATCNVTVTQCNATDIDIDLDKDNKDTYTQKFDEFWQAYPKKRSKGQAEKAWNKLKPDEQLHNRILQSLEQAKTSAEWTKDNGQYIPYPATWLNAKGWEDEYTTKPKKEYRDEWGID